MRYAAKEHQIVLERGMRLKYIHVALIIIIIT